MNKASGAVRVLNPKMVPPQATVGHAVTEVKPVCQQPAETLETHA